MLILLKICSIGILLPFSFRLVNGYHFLGGSMTWKPRHFQPKHSDWVSIDLDIIKNEQHKWGASEKRNWIIIKKNASFEIGFQEPEWSNELNKHEPLAGSISTFISTIPRSNVHISVHQSNLNTPPSTIMPLIQHVRLHTVWSWKIPVVDEDGDLVRCRWANSAHVNECGDVCRPPRNAHLDGDHCILNYTAMEQKSIVIAIKIEDFERNSPQKSLSSTSLQCIIRVSSKPINCSQPPQYVNQSRNDSTVNIFECETWRDQVQFSTSCENVHIEDVQTIKPSDMIIKTAQETSSSHLHTVNITWTLIYEDLGGHSVCFQPLDSIGQYGSFTCIQYLVIGSMIPVGLVNSNQSLWTFQYGRINVRTNLTALNQSETFFTFSTHFKWIEDEQYYILFDTGVLVDKTRCGLVSRAVHEPSFWIFEILSKNKSTKRSLFFVAPICEVGSECDVFKKYCSHGNPCQNGGTCENRNTLLYRYRCACLPDFNGTHYEIDNRPCHPNSCLNYGSCYSTSSTTFNCLCPAPWEGRFCETKINYCHGITCQNRGVCQSLTNNSICKCLGDHYYYGRYWDYCEIICLCAVIAMAVVAILVVVMDILKYGFGIDPVHEEREKLRQERRAKRRHFLVRRYGFVNKVDESHVASASFSVAIETIA
ncbi:hypothetical protein I4U23_023070 [Adineta vaga]|nr:hypothetical protein I4U23_023070 [Adineta vaga]